jgi:hypothetical protein
MQKCMEKIRCIVSRHSTLPLECYLLAKMFVWVIWLVWVHKHGVMVPFWRALGATGGLPVWTLWACLIMWLTCVGAMRKKYAVLRMMALAMASVYWMSLSIIIYYAIESALLPILAAIAAVGCLWSLLYRVTGSK